MNSAKLLEEMNQKPEMKFVGASVLNSEFFNLNAELFLKMIFILY